MTQHDQLLLPHDLRLIDDLHLGIPEVVGTYLVLGDEPALVDPGPTNTLSNLEAGLARNGLSFDDIRAILLTHIHFDHAGATGALVARYPHLRVYVHQRGAPHLIAPERLVRSATRLYGDEMDRLWGDFLAVPEDQITTLGGGETIRLGRRTLNVIDSPGHASHHVIYFEEATRVAFTGDTAGVRLPGAISRPPTPPPDIDIEAWQQTLDTLESLQPQLLLVTHYGPVDRAPEHIADFRVRLVRWAEVVREGLASGEDEPAQIDRLRAFAAREDEGPQVQHAAPIEQCWQGLARYWRKRAENEPP
jgi:glyoxylase-like metal-dependent hydrolase (beta-lactamase superfamily II)